MLVREKEGKENLISKQEELIRTNLDEHEKKMHDVAKFNRLHEKAKQNEHTYNAGPSEFKATELEKEKKELVKKIKNFEGQFIQNQSQLIAKEIKSAEISKSIFLGSVL